MSDGNRSRVHVHRREPNPGLRKEYGSLKSISSKAENNSQKVTGISMFTLDGMNNANDRNLRNLPTEDATYVSDDVEFVDVIEGTSDFGTADYTTEEMENSSTEPMILSGEEGEDLGGQNIPTFIQFFAKSSGPPQIVFLSTLYALAVGCTIGVVPTVLTDQYAKVYHNFDPSDSCANYSNDQKPHACSDGASDAQTGAVSSSFVSNTMLFLTSSLVGSFSDEYGRRQLLIFAQFSGIFSPLILILMQRSMVNPNWYYFSQCVGSCLSWITIALSSLSDVMPKQWRGAVFGLTLGGFSLGLALSPILALGLTHYGVSIFSFAMIFGGLLYSIYFLPETLSERVMEAARFQRSQVPTRDELLLYKAVRVLYRPFKELSILNRNCLFRLLSALAFFSGMSTSADQTLLVYYVEEQLDFKDADIAILFGIIGLQGIFVQVVLFKPFTDLIGERYVVVVSFICGIVTNVLYAFARSKQRIFLAVCISSFGTMSFPTISAMKSNNVAEHELGRVQGALYALSSLASATGPPLLRIAYQATKETKYPGSFFLIAAAFFVVATVCGWALPVDKANTVTRTRRRDGTSESQLSDDEFGQPLLSSTQSDTRT